MKELLKQLAAYNIWAHQKIADVILGLPEEKQMAEVPSSFNVFTKLFYICGIQKVSGGNV